jgi:hypothetical protein
MNKRAQTHGLPGSEKIDKDLKNTGPNKAKPMQKPTEDSRFQLSGQEKKKSLRESINNSSFMNDKFDKLFESVMNEDELSHEIDSSLDTGLEDSAEAALDLGNEGEVDTETMSTHEKLMHVVELLQDIVSELQGEGPEHEAGETEGEEAAEHESGEEGPDEAISEEGYVEAEPKAFADSHGATLQKHGNNKPSSPGTNPKGGKAQNANLKVEADPKGLSDSHGASLQKHGNSKPNSKISSTQKGTDNVFAL